MKQEGSFIKSLIEIIPLILFFVANAKYGIMFATKVFVATTIIALFVSYLYLKKIVNPPKTRTKQDVIKSGVEIFFKCK